jgi:hypothetical protein
MTITKRPQPAKFASVAQAVKQLSGRLVYRPAQAGGQAIMAPSELCSSWVSAGPGVSMMAARSRSSSVRRSAVAPDIYASGAWRVRIRI